MLLSLEILAWSLERHQPHLSILSSRRNLVGAVLGRKTSSPDNMSEGTEGASVAAPSALPVHAPDYLICFPGADTLYCESATGSIKFSSCDPILVFNEILAVFASLISWESRIASAFLDFSGWQHIMDIFNEVVERATYLLNGSGRVLCLNPVFAETPITEDWLVIAATRMLNTSAFETMKRFEVTSNAYIAEVEDKTLCRYIQCSLTPENPYEILLIILEWGKPLGIAELHFAESLQAIAQQVNLKQLMHYTPVSQVFEKLALRKEVEPEELAWNLIRLKWEFAERFYAAVLTQQKCRTPAEQRELQIDVGFLLDVLPRCVVFVQEKQIVIIFQWEDLDSICASLIGILSSREYACGISGKFGEWNLLADALAMANAVSVLAQEARPPLLKAEECTGDLLLHYFNSITKSFSLEHPAAVTLSRYDGENHTEFLLTLYRYFCLSQNSLKTARDLMIHRNTLAYRLEAIKRLTNFEWSDHHQRILFLLSAETLLEASRGTCQNNLDEQFLQPGGYEEFRAKGLRF